MLLHAGWWRLKSPAVMILVGVSLSLLVVSMVSSLNFFLPAAKHPCNTSEAAAKSCSGFSP
jgi:hypothetical protein